MARPSVQVVVPMHEESSSSVDRKRSIWSMKSPLAMLGSNYNEDTFAGLPGPNGNKASVAGKPALLAVLGLWGLFVLNRALHPMLIDLSKGADGTMHYSKLSPVIAKSFVSVLACNFCALFDKDGWKAGLAKCYGGASMRVFGVIGALYALGDYLEMMSMASMDGAAYQVLLQSKLMITALMMWCIKGRSARQTSAQWSVLVTVSIGMTLFMLVQPLAVGKSGGQSSGMVGTLFVLAKVVVSCYSAVKADQSLKAFKHLPLCAQLSQLMFTWGIVLVFMAVILEPSAVCSTGAFFRGWDTATLGVVLSFSAKTVLTMTLLKVLDSVQKNIGEAVAMLVIYFGQVVLPAFSQTFELNTFLAMLVVMLAVTTYMLLKKEADERKKANQNGKQEAAEDEKRERLGGPDAKCRPRPAGSKV